MKPQPELARYLHQMVSDFHLQNVDVLDTALSATPGTLRLYRPDGQVTPGASVQQGVFGMGEQAIDVAVTSTLPGIITNTAWVSTTNTDFDPANNLERSSRIPTSPRRHGWASARNAG